jgi:hypothetical protein
VAIGCCQYGWIDSGGVVCFGNSRRREGLRILGCGVGESAISQEDEGKAWRWNLDLTGIGSCITSDGFNIQVSIETTI